MSNSEPGVSILWQSTEWLILLRQLAGVVRAVEATLSVLTGPSVDMVHCSLLKTITARETVDMNAGQQPETQM